MIFDPSHIRSNLSTSFLSRVLGAGALVAMSSACVGPPTQGPAAAAAADRLSLPERTNPEVFYYVGAAEISGMREEFAEAARLYREAALLSDDADIAEQALRAAAQAADQDLMIAGAERLLELDGAGGLYAHNVLADLYLQQGRVDDAWAQMEVLLERGEAASAWGSIKQILARTRNRALAREIYQRLRDYPPLNDTEFVQEMSDLGVLLGDSEGALHYADLAIERAPENAEAWAWRGRLRRVAGDLEGSMSDLTRAVEIDPNTPLHRRALAEVLADTGQLEAALAQLDQLEPELRVVYTQTFYALQAGMPERALAHYQQLQELPVDDVDEKYFFLGQLAEALERPADEALSWYRQVSGGEHLENARLRSAVVLANSDRMEQAQAILSRLQDGGADMATRAFIAEAGLLRAAGDDPAAMAVYNRGLELLSDNSDLLFTRALLAEELDQLDQAETDLRRVLELEPENFNAMNALGYTLADRTDRYDEALVLIEKALELSPDSAAIVDSMGWVQFKLGNHVEALAQLERALELQFDPEIAAHLGEVLWAVGRRDDALAVWADALEQAPDSEVILSTRDRLNR